MSLHDKEKWDRKYQEKSTLLNVRSASPYLQKLVSSTSNLYALDLACGAGRNSLYLATLGYQVTAIDIAKIALETLREEGKKSKLDNKLNVLLKDLDSYTPEIESFDLIVMTNYLDRTLIERSKNALKKGGIFFVETYMKDKMNEKENSNQSYLLDSEELKNIFINGYQTIFYKEFENEPNELYRMKKQVIAVKKL